MKEILKEHRSLVVILLEPRISGDTAEDMCKKLGKDRWIRSEAAGFSGGVWILWNVGDISVKLLYVDRFFLHFEVKMGGRKEWVMTAVYVSPNPYVRRHLREKLNEMEVTRPWLVVGDFNSVLHDEERSSMSSASTSFQAG